MNILENQTQNFFSTVRNRLGIGEKTHFYVEKPDIQIVLTVSKNPQHLSFVNGIEIIEGKHSSDLLYGLRRIMESEITIKKSFRERIIRENVAWALNLKTTSHKFEDKERQILLSYEPEIDFQAIFKGKLAKLFDQIYPFFPDLAVEEKNDLRVYLNEIAKREDQCMVCKNRVTISASFGGRICGSCYIFFKKYFKTAKDKNSINYLCKNGDFKCEQVNYRNCNGCRLEFGLMIDLQYKIEPSENVAILNQKDEQRGANNKRKSNNEGKENSNPSKIKRK
jgi:hypothetical protein